MDDYRRCSDFASLKASLRSRPSSGRPPDSRRSEGGESAAVSDSTVDPKQNTARDFDVGNMECPEAADSFPLLSAHRLSTGTGNSRITSADFDPSSVTGRLLAGTASGLLVFYDFSKMAAAPSRLIQLDADGTPVAFLRYAAGGRAALLATRGSPPLLLDAGSGKLMQECSRGDRYVMDQRRVKGHTGRVVCGEWLEEERFVTGGEDGTVRAWRVGRKEQERVIGLLNKHVQDGFRRRPVVGCVVRARAGEVLAGVDDGIVRMYDDRSGCDRPACFFDTKTGAYISSVLPLDRDVLMMMGVKSEEGVAVFDQRRPDHVVAQLQAPSLDHNQMFLMNDGRLVASFSDKKKSRLFVLDPTDLSVESSLDHHHNYHYSSISCISYSSQLNQLAIGSNQMVDIYYDPAASKKGVLLLQHAAAGSVPAKQPEYFVSPGVAASTIYTPNALPLFAPAPDEAEVLADPLNLRRLKDRLDVHRSARPDVPIRGEGHEGRIGSGPNAAYMRQIMHRQARCAGREKYFDRDEDPREALLKYAEIAQREPKFVQPAYSESQPVPVFDYDRLEREAERAAAKRARETK